MDLMLASTLIKMALDTGNIVKLVTEFGQKFKRAPNAEEFTNLETEANKRIENLNLSQQNLGISLSDTIMPVIVDKLTLIKKRIADTYRDAGLSNFDKQQQLDRIQRDYCFYIKEIRRYNGDSLPTLLQTEWEQNSCGNYAF